MCQERTDAPNSTPIICNYCGRTLDFFDRQQEFKIQTHILYGSKFDGDNVDLNLCCDCFDHLVERCAVSPIEDGKARKEG